MYLERKFSDHHRYLRRKLLIYMKKNVDGFGYYNIGACGLFVHSRLPRTPSVGGPTTSRIMAISEDLPPTQHLGWPHPSSSHQQVWEMSASNLLHPCPTSPRHSIQPRPGRIHCTRGTLPSCVALFCSSPEWWFPIVVVCLFSVIVKIKTTIMLIS